MLCPPFPRTGVGAVTPASRAGSRQARPAAAAPKFALLVGVNRYLDKNVKTLNGCENDVDDMKDVLTKVFQFANDREHVLTLKSEEAKKQRILDEFKKHLIENAKKFKDQKPTVVFYFSGHGSTAVDGPDQDEGDRQDETILPHDRGVRGVTDILDDDLDKLFGELRQYTTNITFIIDSCHSGTATRAVDFEPRKAPPLNPAAAAQEFVSGPKDKGNAMLERRIDSYVTLSGCLPSQLSYEYVHKTADNKLRTNGVMTAHLVQALRARPNATYRELGETVRRAVEEKLPVQSPQAEGNLDRLIFEGADPNARNYIAVNAADKAAGTVTIAAGRAQGLKKGTFIAVYSQKARKLSGVEDKLGDAEVIELRDFESTALLQRNAKPIAPGDKAIVLTPYFGSERLRVALDTSTTNGRPGAEVIKGIETLLRNDSRAATGPDKRNPLVEVASATSRPLAGPAGADWDVAVVRDTFMQYRNALRKPRASAKETAAPPDKTDVYYVASRGGSPLYEFYVRADAPDAAAEIVDVLERRARQKNVAAISNSGSALTPRIRVTLLKVQLDGAGKETPVAELPATTEGTQTLKFGERFRFRVVNTSGQKLFLTLIAINPSGGISVISTPEDFGGEVSPNTSVKSERIKTGPPEGKTIFKLIVTTKKVDFSFLGQPPLTRDAKGDRGLTNPFARLVGQAYFGGMREAAKDTVQGFDDWTTVDIDLVVSGS
ncbi:MAG TPA: caspase family protein [Pyrinomonadaceae bacterium]